MIFAKILFESLNAPNKSELSVRAILISSLPLPAIRLIELIIIVPAPALTVPTVNVSELGVPVKSISIARLIALANVRLPKLLVSIPPFTVLSNESVLLFVNPSRVNEPSSSTLIVPPFIVIELPLTAPSAFNIEPAAIVIAPLEPEIPLFILVNEEVSRLIVPVL